jgi:hypothetical protein
MGASHKAHHRKVVIGRPGRFQALGRFFSWARFDTSSVGAQMPEPGAGHVVLGAGLAYLKLHRIP